MSKGDNIFSDIGAADTIKTSVKDEKLTTLKQTYNRETGNNSKLTDQKLPNDVSNSSLIGNETFHPGPMVRESYKVYDTDGSVLEDTESKRFSTNRKKSADKGLKSKKNSRTEISTRIDN